MLNLKGLAKSGLEIEFKTDDERYEFLQMYIAQDGEEFASKHDINNLGYNIYLFINLKDGKINYQNSQKLDKLAEKWSSIRNKRNSSSYSNVLLRCVSSTNPYFFTEGENYKIEYGRLYCNDGIYDDDKYTDIQNVNESIQFAKFEEINKPTGYNAKVRLSKSTKPDLIGKEYDVIDGAIYEDGNPIVQYFINIENLNDLFIQHHFEEI